MRAASDAEPISRILYGVAAADGHSSRPVITDRLKRPTRKFGVSEQRRILNMASPSSFLPYLVLLRVGFAMRRALLRDRCALTAPFHPYPAQSQARGLRLLCLRVRLKADRLAIRSLMCRAVYFLWHFPSSHFSAAPKRATEAPSRTLSGTLLCGVRTFLSLDRAARETRRPRARQRPSGSTSAIHIIR